MNDFLNSKFMVDLKDGKLPAVTIDFTSILMLSGSMAAAGVIVIMLYFILKKSSAQ